ncbi:MAG TPA: hypothetical protein VMS77_02650 [Conexivisphaerales archaeon]|nr:hypothetical protein [Conexivisphaerales archaeon]
MTEEETLECVRRHQGGESLWDLADEYPFSAETIRKAIISHGVKTRDKVEAQIQKVTKYQKKPFGGDPHEKAYLYGMKQGDLWVTRHGRAIRIKTSSTHPAMIELIASLFLPYGAVHILPRKCEMTGYEWSIDCDVDSSFEFLTGECKGIPHCIGDDTFRDYLAGFFDAEGSVMVHRPSNAPRLDIANSNLRLLGELKARMPPSYPEWKIRLTQAKGTGRDIIAQTDQWRLSAWQVETCRGFLHDVPFRHPEKKAKARLVVRDLQDEAQPPLDVAFDVLKASIKSDVREFVALAKSIVGSKIGSNGQPTKLGQ